MPEPQKNKSIIWGLVLSVFITCGVIYLIFTTEQVEPVTTHIIHFDPTYADEITIRENEILELILNGGTTDNTIIRKINSSIFANQRIIAELSVLEHTDLESEEFKSQVIEYAEITNEFLEELEDGVKDGSDTYPDDMDYRLELYDEIIDKVHAYEYEPI